MTQFWRDRWQQFVALLILINLILVVFDLSYLPLRPFCLRQLPTLVERYDPIKGVMPHPVTQDCFAQITQLRQQLADDQPVSNLSLLQDRSITRKANLDSWSFSKEISYTAKHYTDKVKKDSRIN
ncbi:MAG: hypothetical protein AAFQ95_22060 [Cyanobacteria bacterium J06621_3]